MQKENRNQVSENNGQFSITKECYKAVKEYCSKHKIEISSFIEYAIVEKLFNIKKDGDY